MEMLLRGRRVSAAIELFLDGDGYAGIFTNVLDHFSDSVEVGIHQQLAALSGFVAHVIPQLPNDRRSEFEKY
jgi:hypothetical protein